MSGLSRFLSNAFTALAPTLAIGILIAGASGLDPIYLPPYPQQPVTVLRPFVGVQRRGVLIGVFTPMSIGRRDRSIDRVWLLIHYVRHPSVSDVATNAGPAGLVVVAQMRAIVMPHGVAALLLCVAPLVRVLRWVRERSRDPSKTDRCPACGYDLRATPERCPECGRPTTKST